MSPTRALPCLAALAILALAACDSSPIDAGCPTTGVGAIRIAITGLPASGVGEVTVSGPSGTFVTSDTATFSSLAAGEYDIRIKPWAATDSLVSVAYGAPAEHYGTCVVEGPTQQFIVVYHSLLTSGRAWVGVGQNAVALTSAQLGASSTLAPDLAKIVGAASGMTFDRGGDLWVAIATNTGPVVRRYTVSSLGLPNDPPAEATIVVKGLNCEGRSSLAFDEAGGLWVSSQCAKRVVRLSPSQLEGTASATPLVVISALDQPDGIAFDATGNLWIADGDHLRKYVAARLGASTNQAADLSVAFTRPVVPDPNDHSLSINQIAFDTTGALWGSTYYENAIFRVDVTGLPASGSTTREPSPIIHLSSFAYLRGFAFDNSGGLLTAWQSGTFARLSPAQLGTSSIPSSPTVPARVFTSSSLLPYGENVVLFPAPKGTPLYHRAR